MQALHNCSNVEPDHITSDLGMFTNKHCISDPSQLSPFKSLFTIIHIHIPHSYPHPRSRTTLISHKVCRVPPDASALEPDSSVFRFWIDFQVCHAPLPLPLVSR